MDYQEAIEILAEVKKVVCGEDEVYKAFDTSISAMQELQMYKDAKLCLIPEDVYAKQCDELDGYKKLGTLEEIQEAMERKNECRNCVYKIHSDGISKLNSCNDCGLSNTCEKRPEYGKYCRINCYDWNEKL